MPTTSLLTRYLTRRLAHALSFFRSKPMELMEAPRVAQTQASLRPRRHMTADLPVASEMKRPLVDRVTVTRARWKIRRGLP